MNTNFEENKNIIAAEINEKIRDMKCPVCKNSDFLLPAGFFAHDLQKDLSSRQMGGLNIPTVPIICKKCGFVMEFAVGALGLLPKNNSTASDNKLSEKDGE